MSIYEIGYFVSALLLSVSCFAASAKWSCIVAKIGTFLFVITFIFAEVVE